MLRSLAARAVVPVALTVTGFVVVCCVLLYSFIKQDMVNDAIQREVSLADTLIKSTRYTMLKADRETLRETIRNIGEQHGVEHVRIFNKKGLIMFSAEPSELDRLVDKKSEGCVECHDGPEPATALGPMERARGFTNERGEYVLAITAPIYNEAGCSLAACHEPAPEAQVLGTLDIGLSQGQLKRNLATLGWRMASFCLMVMILTVGGVMALLRRSVFLPIRELLTYAEGVAEGRAEREPPRGADEVERLGRFFHQIAERLHRHSRDEDKVPVEEKEKGDGTG